MLSNPAWMRSSPPTTNNMYAEIDHLLDKDENEKVRLSKKGRTLDDKSAGVLIEVKRDGVFLRIYKDSDGSVFTCTKFTPVFRKHLDQLLARKLEAMPPNTRLDAELVAHNNKGWMEAWRMVHRDIKGTSVIHIFDCPFYDGNSTANMTLYDRKKLIQNIQKITAGVKNPHIHFATLDAPGTLVVKKSVNHPIMDKYTGPAPEGTMEHARRTVTAFVKHHITEEKAEGFVLKRLRSTYHATKNLVRSTNWVKFKPEHTHAFDVVAEIKMRKVKPQPVRLNIKRPGEPPCRWTNPEKTKQHTYTLDVYLAQNQYVGTMTPDASFNLQLMKRIEHNLRNQETTYAVITFDVRPHLVNTPDHPLYHIMPEQGHKQLTLRTPRPVRLTNTAPTLTRKQVFTRIMDLELRTKAMLATK